MELFGMESVLIWLYFFNKNHSLESLEQWFTNCSMQQNYLQVHIPCLFHDQKPIRLAGGRGLETLGLTTLWETSLLQRISSLKLWVLPRVLNQVEEGRQASEREVDKPSQSVPSGAVSYLAGVTYYTSTVCFIWGAGNPWWSTAWKLPQRKKFKRNKSTFCVFPGCLNEIKKSLGAGWTRQGYKGWIVVL